MIFSTDYEVSVKNILTIMHTVSLQREQEVIWQNYKICMTEM